MQHFLAQEVEAKHRRREFARQMKMQTLIALACPETKQTLGPTWQDRNITRWRSLLGIQVLFAPFLPRPSR